MGPGVTRGERRHRDLSGFCLLARKPRESAVKIPLSSGWLDGGEIHLRAGGSDRLSAGPRCSRRSSCGRIPRSCGRPRAEARGYVLRGRRGSTWPHHCRTVAGPVDLAERYASGDLRTTNMQNLLILNVPERNVDAMVQELQAAELRVEGSPFWRGAIACTGTEFCKLAITETKSYARWLVEELEERLPGFDQHLKIHITGCPNSCGQHWIAEIGLEGKKMKVAAKMVDAYYFCVGGGVGKYRNFARLTGYRCLASEVPEAIERLPVTYLAERRKGENFRQFCARFTDDELRATLAGAEVNAVARDPSPGRPPHGVEA